MTHIRMIVAIIVMLGFAITTALPMPARAMMPNHAVSAHDAPCHTQTDKKPATPSHSSDCCDQFCQGAVCPVLGKIIPVSLSDMPVILEKDSMINRLSVHLHSDIRHQIRRPPKTIPNYI